MRNTGSCFRTNFTVITIGGIHSWARRTRRAVTRNTAVVLTDISKLTIANVTTTFFASTGGWVAVLVKAAVYRGAARAYWNAGSTTGVR